MRTRTTRKHITARSAKSFDDVDGDADSDVSVTSSMASQRRKIVPTATSIAAMRDGLNTSIPQIKGETLASQRKSRTLPPEPHRLQGTNLQPFSDPLSQFARDLECGEDSDEDANPVPKRSTAIPGESDRSNAFTSTVSSFVSALRTNFNFTIDSQHTTPSTPLTNLSRTKPPQPEVAQEANDPFPRRSRPLTGHRSFVEPPSMQPEDESPPPVARQLQTQTQLQKTAERATSQRPVVHSRLRSADGTCLDLTLEEIAYMQSVANEAELETLMVDSQLYASVASGAVCFNCLKARLGRLLDRGVQCKVCLRRVCERCTAMLRVPGTPALFTLPIVFVLQSDVSLRQRSHSASDDAQPSHRLLDWKTSLGASHLQVCLACYCVIVDNVEKCRNGLVTRNVK